jgi:hypothetical protein
MDVLLFFIIPIKVKYLAWFTWAIVALTFLLGEKETRVGIVASLANYLLFFGPDIWQNLQLKWHVFKNRDRFKP